MRGLFIAFITAMVLLSACTSIDCSLNNTVGCVWSVSYADGDSVTPKRYITMSAMKTNDDNDTILANLTQNLKSLTLPMSYVLDEDVMHIWFAEGDSVIGVDEIRVNKSNSPVFESVNCDTRYHHHINSVTSTTNFVDSVVIIDPEVTNITSNENIRIYLHSAQ